MMLNVNDVKLKIDRRFVLMGASLKVLEGQTLALVGESGCGKTSLLRCIAGLEEISDGIIEMDGRIMSGRGQHVAPGKRGVGLVFQDLALFPHITVSQNILFGLSRHPQHIQQKRLREMLQLFQLEEMDGRLPHQLSGGQQQRVALARALAPHPRLLLLDEPFSGYDILLRDSVRRDLRNLLDAVGITTVMVTHDLQDALIMADEICIMRAGKVLQQGSAKELSTNPVDEYVAMFMGAVNRIEVDLTDANPSFLLNLPIYNRIRSGAVLVFPADALITAEAGSPGSFEVAVERIMPLAKGLLVWCRTLSTPSISLNALLNRAPDAEIHLKLLPEKVHVFPLKN